MATKRRQSERSKLLEANSILNAQLTEARVRVDRLHGDLDAREKVERDRQDLARQIDAAVLSLNRLCVAAKKAGMAVHMQPGVDHHGDPGFNATIVLAEIVRR